MSQIVTGDVVVVTTRPGERFEVLACLDGVIALRSEGDASGNCFLVREGQVFPVQERPAKAPGCPAMGRSGSLPGVEPSAAPRAVQGDDSGKGSARGLWQLFHHLWSKAVSSPGYDKRQWVELERLTSIHCHPVPGKVEVRTGPELEVMITYRCGCPLVPSSKVKAFCPEHLQSIAPTEVSNDPQCGSAEQRLGEGS